MCDQHNEEQVAVADAALQNEGEVKPKKLTLQEYKSAMRAFFTVRHQVVQTCGHAFHPTNTPKKANCEYCWFAYFQVHGEVTQLIDEIFQEHGAVTVIKLHGEKFFKNWLKFMATLARMQMIQQQAQEEKEKVEQSTGHAGIGSGSTTANSEESNEGSVNNGGEVESTRSASQDAGQAV